MSTKLDAPFGLKFRGNLAPGNRTPIRYYDADTTAAAIFRGTPLVLNGSGRLVPWSGASAIVVGVSLSHVPISGVVTDVPIISPLGSTFLIQCDGTIAASRAAFMTLLDDALQGFTFVNPGAGNATTGLSTCELNVTPGAISTTNLLRLASPFWEDRPDNVLGGANLEVVVRFDDAAIATTPEFII